MKIDPQNGAILDATFINGAGIYSTPKGVAFVDNEIWVSDQLTDTVYRYTSAGVPISSIVGGMDNIRGLAKVGNEVWVSNAGTANGAPGPAIVRISTSGTIIGSFTTSGTSPFDVLVRNGEVLVSDSNTHDVDRYDFSGNFLGKFYDNPVSTGTLRFPQQLANSGTDLLVAAFSPTNGVFRFNSSGVQTGYWQIVTASNCRGIALLGNGIIAFTAGSFVGTVDPATNSTAILHNIANSSFQYFAMPAAPTSQRINANYTIISGQLLGGNTESLLESDNNRLLIICDENDAAGEIVFDGTSPILAPSSLSYSAEIISVRDDQSVFTEAFNFQTNDYVEVDFRISSLSDTSYGGSVPTPVASYVGTAGEVRARIRWIPSQDLDSGDGWSNGVDVFYWDVQ